MDRRRHLARGARQAPVGDQRDAMAAVLQHAERRHQLVQLRHADRLRPLKAHHRDEVAVEFAGPEGRMQLLLAVEHPRRRLDHVPFGRDRRGLDDRPSRADPRAPASRRSAGTGRPRRAIRCDRRTRAGAARPGHGAFVVEMRLHRIVARRSPQTVCASPCRSPAPRSSRIRRPMPPAAWKWFTSALPFG